MQVRDDRRCGANCSRAGGQAGKIGKCGSEPPPLQSSCWRRWLSAQLSRVEPYEAQMRRNSRARQARQRETAGMLAARRNGWSMVHE